jgi:Mg2+/Co2+ transporter CorC
MFIMYPLAYPIAHTLDRLLGGSHKTVYCRAELKELVSMHDHELIPDEVRIIKSVLDLREKSAVVSMTHLKDAFMLDWDDVIDRDTIERILSKGHSRVPVYYRERENIIGMVLVKKLVAVKKGTPVRKISLSPLLGFPSTTPLFEIMNIFQQGKSHMATVYEKSRGKEKAIGIITLEDVIEELIGGEIVDETDEYFSNEGKIKVIRQLKRNSFIQSSASPRLHILNQNPLAMYKATNPNPTLTTEFPGHSTIPQIIKTDSSQSPQDGDLVLVTAIPGKSFMGRVIDPYEDYDYTEQNNGTNYGSLGHSKGPLLVVPSVNPPCADPSVHLLDYNRHPEPQYHCSLIHPQNNSSTRPKSKHSSKTPKNRRSQTLPLLSTEDNSENDYTTGINTPKTEFETSPQPKLSSLPNPTEEFKPIIEVSTKLLNS